jgi:hypothetical protein
MHALPRFLDKQVGVEYTWRSWECIATSTDPQRDNAVAGHDTKTLEPKIETQSIEHMPYSCYTIYPTTHPMGGSNTVDRAFIPTQPPM